MSPFFYGIAYASIVLALDATGVRATVLFPSLRPAVIAVLLWVVVLGATTVTFVPPELLSTASVVPASTAEETSILVEFSVEKNYYPNHQLHSDVYLLQNRTIKLRICPTEGNMVAQEPVLDAKQRV